MAFQFNAFGQKVARDPAAAHARLVALFAKHDCSTAAVASELGANALTLRRWIAKLAGLGYPDPGGGARRARGADVKERSQAQHEARARKKKSPAVR